MSFKKQMKSTYYQESNTSSLEIKDKLSFQKKRPFQLSIVWKASLGFVVALALVLGISLGIQGGKKNGSNGSCDPMEPNQDASSEQIPSGSDNLDDSSNSSGELVVPGEADQGNSLRSLLMNLLERTPISEYDTLDLSTYTSNNVLGSIVYEGMEYSIYEVSKDGENYYLVVTLDKVQLYQK